MCSLYRVIGDQRLDQTAAHNMLNILRGLQLSLNPPLTPVTQPLSDITQRKLKTVKLKHTKFQSIEFDEQTVVI